MRIHDYAAALRRARLRAGFPTVASVAEAAGVDRKTYNPYEVGLQNPSLAVLTRVADATGASIDELCGHAFSCPSAPVSARALLFAALAADQPGAWLADVADVLREMSLYEKGAEDVQDD